MTAASERLARSASTYVDALIIPTSDTTTPRVLLIRDAEGWRLPSLSWSERHFWQTTHSVNRCVLDTFGFDAVALRCVSIEESDDRSRFIYEMDTLSHPESVPDGCWASLEDLAGVALIPPSDRIFIEHWLTEQHSEECLSLRPEWSRQGWFAETAGWIRKMLAADGRSLVGPVEQVRAWGRSTVLRAPTTTGHVFLKAVPPMFAHEVAVTTYLEERFPNCGVTTVAMDCRRGTMLMEQLPGTPLEEISQLAAWQRAFRSLADLQIALVDSTRDLLQRCCPERLLDGLRAAIPGIAVDAELQLRGLSGGLTSEQSQRLQDSVPILQQCCDQLAAFGIPMSLDHGDLHPGNIVVDGEYDRFFDWSDCAISHPFFTLVLYFEDTAGALEQNDLSRTAIRDAYLEPWSRMMPESDLHRAFELAQVLAPVAYAWMYQSQIQPGIEQPWEMERMAPHYLRTALTRIETLAEAGV